MTTNVHTHSETNGSKPWSDAALAFFEVHAIDPAVAHRCGVAERNGYLVFPIRAEGGTTFARRRPLRDRR